jgi:phosphatidyl-myo-inositol dimannoside synthase
MRILLIADSLTPTYGWGRYSLGVVQALRRQGLDFTLLSPKAYCTVTEIADIPDHQRVTSFVGETRRLSKLVVANALPIWRALQRCDAVHCLTEPYAIPAALVKGKKPLFVTLHGTYAVRPFTRPSERLWYEFAYRQAARLLPVSHFTESLLPTRFRGPRTQMVPEGVDTARFQSARDVPPPARPFILSVGPIKRRKGYHATVEAFARVHQARPDVEYLIAGGTDDRVFLTQLQQRIRELGLERSITFLGRISDDDLARLYQQCALFWLLPVDDDLQFEGFGLVYWEANASGRPIIGAKRTGAEDAIEDGLNGYLVEANDSPAAAGAALRLLEDPELAMRMGHAGRMKVRPWDDAARLLMQQYREVIAGGWSTSVAANSPQ